MYLSRRAAFTLVELSVVIVIIGLLAGGAVATRSFIKNSKLSSLMVDAQSQISAFTLFQEKYNAIPGDFAQASTTWNNADDGDGNGLIRAGSGNTSETFYASEHLALAGMISGAYQGDSGELTPGLTLPPTPYPGTVFQFDHPDAVDGNVSGDAYYQNGLYRHVLKAGFVKTGDYPTATGPFLTGEQALALDKKYDDGQYRTGNLTISKLAESAGCAGGMPFPDYLTNNPVALCDIILRVP